MKIVVFFLEFAAAWFVGNIISASITQIGCCLFCSFPILRRLEPYADSINVSKAQAFYWRTVLIHAAFLAVTSWVVIAYMPDAVIWGFFLSFAFTVLIGAGRWGRNSVNVEEFLKIIEKFVAPGKDDAAFYALSGVLTNWDNWEKPKKESSGLLRKVAITVVMWGISRFIPAFVNTAYPLGVWMLFAPTFLLPFSWGAALAISKGRYPMCIRINLYVMVALEGMGAVKEAINELMNHTYSYNDISYLIWAVAVALHVGICVYLAWMVDRVKN